ncbi:COX15/CtaA family protein [Luedemannella helvata]|uniref:COX15/CtaA family protein n=1 Tax=Luedemannella helvata TaxID=349315 RepID=A0ABP4WXY6_9ACTN
MGHVSSLASRTLLRRFALASLAANVGIVITGGVVRLTGSGLGCPTWPRCTEESYVTTAAMGHHGVIEFGNRLLTFVVGALAVLCVVLAEIRRRRGGRDWSETRLALLVFAGIPLQGVIGGFTVLTDLNPWVVGLHFLGSMAVIAAAYALVSATSAAAAPSWQAPSAVRRLGQVLVFVSALVLVAGVVVTGSGPHAGDENAHRTGLDPEMISQLHVDVVMLLLGLSIAMIFVVRATGGPIRRAVILLGVELAQGLIGFVQYFTHLPEVLVAMHMGGACLVWIATLALYDVLRARAVAPDVVPVSPAAVLARV